MHQARPLEPAIDERALPIAAMFRRGRRCRLARLHGVSFHVLVFLFTATISQLDTALAEREQLRERVETMRSKIESLKAKVEHNRQREASRRTAQERTADKGLRGWLRRLGR